MYRCTTDVAMTFPAAGSYTTYLTVYPRSTLIQSLEQLNLQSHLMPSNMFRYFKQQYMFAHLQTGDQHSTGSNRLNTIQCVMWLVHAKIR